MLEFERVFSHLVHFALNNQKSTQNNTINKTTNNPDEINSNDLGLNPTFFDKLSSTKNWKEFEKYTYYILKLLGISTLYHFLDERQAGKADGFLKIGNLAVIYDCTLAKGDIEENKSQQINNYCNLLQQGSINISENTKEEFFSYNKQLWIITQRKTRQIKTINLIIVKEIAVQDLISLYQERLTKMLNNQCLEIRLCNL